MLFFTQSLRENYRTIYLLSSRGLPRDNNKLRALAIGRQTGSDLRTTQPHKKWIKRQLDKTPLETRRAYLETDNSYNSMIKHYHPVNTSW
ncbi:MAG: hypothetical protein CSA34_01320 [Desulfobulbus propionicus]|nr:MAG: hypothetical protein CSA34_01320 [Desulfobulbus propionicus]